MNFRAIEIGAFSENSILLEGPFVEPLVNFSVDIVEGQWGRNIPKYEQIVLLHQLCENTIKAFSSEADFWDWKTSRTKKWNDWIDTQDQISPVPSFRTFVYLMRCNRTKLHKIGRAKNPQVREKTLQSENPSMELVFVVEANCSYEKQLHSFFENKRVRGEWFRLTKSDVKAIIRWNGRPPRRRKKPDPMDDPMF